jgi:hypothetical protein
MLKICSPRDTDIMINHENTKCKKHEILIFLLFRVFFLSCFCGIFNYSF